MTAAVPNPEDGLTPYGLTCEMLPTPLGLDEPSPRLSWKLRSARRGDTQTAYRLTMALSPGDLDDPQRLLWDTGRRTAADGVLVPFDGPALHSTTRYHWRVQVWDADGAPAGRADSWFETGLLHADEWRAVWIGRDTQAPAVMDPPDDEDRTERTRHLLPCSHLRRSFDLGDLRPVRARVYASARGVYELRLNGRRVGDAELAPGWTEYHRRVLYQTYDVGDLLEAGENVLGVVLADGWWSGFVGFDSRRQALHYGDAPQVIVQVLLEFADGSQRWIRTDENWRERSGAIRYADLLMGEYVDARDDLPGWDAPGYDDTGWHAAVVLDRATGVLRAAPDQPVRVTEDLPARSVVRRPGGHHIVDLGQNMVGRVRLTIRGAERGQRIRLRHAEMLQDEELYLDNLRTAEATDFYVAAGDPVEVFEPRFTFHGFRYVEVTGYPGDLRAEDVVGRVLHSDTPWTGEFACSDETVTRLQSNIRWSQRGNFVSIPTDCPQRDERLGWLADAQVFLPTACRNADVRAFFARWMRDVVDAQDADGAFPDVAPKLCVPREGAPAWGDGGVIIPWHLYRVYGDRRALERSYPAMAAWVDHIHRHNPDLVWRHHVGNHYGDWLQVDAQTPRDLLATAYFARSAQIVAQAAEVLGEHADTKRYGALHAAVRDTFVDAFVNTGTGADGDAAGDEGRIVGGTQTGYLLALAFDLMPERLVPAAVRHLAADIEARDRHLTTGFVGVSLLCPVLAEHGHADLAYALLHQDTYPSWGHSIRHGATTIWERWDGWTGERGFQSPAMNSFNHYSLGSVGEWLYGGVAGIDQRPGSVAYRHLLLRPRIGGRLTWASARQETPLGAAACGWSLQPEAQPEELHIEVTVPPGAVATLHIPTADPAGVREGRAELPGRAEIEVIDRLPGELVVDLASGTYHFITPPPQH
ncbi:alpha-L-rhamnosidase [Thermomonospora echinospora]|uniref:alpha-L-rhamnosidase n=1 Tax=Thermomonospora echinospora TaxID=1992 RepID=A0A1H6DK04_9ACTN|nr:alpha-L-rhamnosidase [Thermomonospora echinospora]SEG85582.1 alpha-L-rhamnosidase [Thermomonospora echinospora]